MPNVKLQNASRFDFSKYLPQINDFTTDLSYELQSKTFNNLVNSIMNNSTQLSVDGQTQDANYIIDLLTNEIADDDVHNHKNEIASLFVHEISKYQNQTPQNWKQVIANSILLKNNMPLPSPSLLYLYDTDIQNQAKEFLNNPTQDNKTQLEIGLLGNLLNNPISSRWNFILTNDKQYKQLKQQLNNNVNMYNQNSDIAKYNRDVQQIDLDPDNSFTSWMTGNDNTPNSFNRLINYTLTQIQQSSHINLLPINMQAMLNPIGFSFINIETLANTNQSNYNAELKQLQKATNRLVNFKYYKLKKIQNANKVDMESNSTKDYTKSHDELTSHRKSVGFSKTLPKVNSQIKKVAKIVNHHISSIQSSNTYRSHFYSFMRPNRRHPKDMNLRGRVQKIQYRPDIHIYLDTSGSVSEPQYKAAVTMLIKLAKKLNTDLYFTSFSDSISQPFRLHTKNANIKQIYQQIQRIPKVSGGTEYENVWRMIDTIERQNKKHNIAPRLNFVITDFCYGLRSSYTPELNRASTKKTYYLPLASNQSEYESVREYAMEFANELIDKNDTHIKSRIIM